MVTTHRISADIFIEDFELVAVHSDMNDYSLAYHLNKIAGLQLSRRKKDLLLQNGIWFSVFEWMDEMNDNYWMLIHNQCKIKTMNVNEGLFRMETATISKQLVEERKEVDFFLKVETEMPRLINGLLKNLKEIRGIVTAYSIDPATLKSKKNLMF